MVKKEKKTEKRRGETWMRIVVGIVSGITLSVWRYLIFVFMIINFVYGIFTGKRLKELADLSEIWNTQWYAFNRYMIFETHARPFPFTKLQKSMGNFE